MSKNAHCCDMHKKVVLRIAGINDEGVCGVSDLAMAEFHDFSYQSVSNPSMRVAAALSFRFCPWCGTVKDDQDRNRRVVETVVSS